MEMVKVNGIAVAPAELGKWESPSATPTSKIVVSFLLTAIHFYTNEMSSTAPGIEMNSCG